MAFLELNAVSKQFSRDFVAVEHFDLQVEQGEFISLLGPSGCGKTTTLRMVAGFEFPSSGQIMLDGEDITTRPPNQRKVGMVFQSYALFPNMTVADNIGFGLKVAGKPSSEIGARVDEMLDLIHMAEKRKHYPYQLSGGQQQRVALARALAFSPRMLLLDEPLSALDAKIRVELRAEIRRIQQHLGITTLFVTHDQEEALSLSDRVVVMSAGRIEQVGKPLEIYNFPQTGFTASFVGQLNTISVKVVNGAKGEYALKSQKIAAGHQTNLPAGATAQLAIRPQEIKLNRDDKAINLTGHVEQISFLGPVVRVKVAVEDASISVDLFNERGLTLPHENDKVTLSFPPDACWLLQ